MTKRELIDQIAVLNPTAQPAFLADFGDDDLAEYLRHLQWVVPAGGPTYACEPAELAPAPGPLFAQSSVTAVGA